MSDYSETLLLIKKAALDAVMASKPTMVCYGEVVKINPLQISIEQKLILGEKQLILTRGVTSYELNVTVNGVKEIAKVDNSLAAGDKVLLLRMQGGQKYIVLERTAL